MPNYYAKVDAKIENRPGYWDYTKVGVYDGDVRIGEYDRSYPSHGNTTFAPFERDGKWFALYSKDYTKTSVMELPSCKEVCSENSQFCPVEIWVPRGFEIQEKRADGEWEEFMWVWDSKDWEEAKDDLTDTAGINSFQDLYDKYASSASWNNGETYRISPIQYAQYAFISGCIWGDDSGGWKLKVADLRGIPGTFYHTSVMGYLELADDLKKAIDLGGDSTASHFSGRVDTLKHFSWSMDTLEESYKSDLVWKEFSMKQKDTFWEESRDLRTNYKNAMSELRERYGLGPRINDALD